MALPTILSSTSDLVSLYLDDVPKNGYSSPETMVGKFDTPTSRTPLIFQMCMLPFTVTALSALFKTIGRSGLAYSKIQRYFLEETEA